MINLIRDIKKRIIIQKNVKNKQIILEFLKPCKEKIINKKKIIDHLVSNDLYNGRNTLPCENTMGVRYSEMCFYNLCYKDQAHKETVNNLTLTGLNLLEGGDETLNMFVNIFALQFPHPSSKTPNEFKVYFGRLLFTLLIDSRLEHKLYIDEMLYFLLFVREVNEDIYEELIDSILEFRKLSFEDRERLFLETNNCQKLYANCLHEIKYYFIQILEQFHIIELVPDDKDDDKYFRFQHNETTWRNSYLNPRIKKTFYIKLTEKCDMYARKLLAEFSVFDEILTENSKESYIYSRQDWLEGLYEVNLLKYYSVLGNENTTYSKLCHDINHFHNEAIQGSIDGVSFELATEQLLKHFDGTIKSDRIGGSGNPDIVFVAECQGRTVKIVFECKSRNSINNMKVTRVSEHKRRVDADLAVVLAPFFSPSAECDLSYVDVIGLDSKVLGEYMMKFFDKTTNKVPLEPLLQILEASTKENATNKLSRYIEAVYGLV